jgi:hypothetical protein
MKRFLIIIFSVIIFNNVSAQNTLDNVGLNAGTPAASAYSLRLLSTSYAGSAIQVRRSSDNTTQDIGFTGSGDLDTTALKTFVGANNGFITIWYDQSGNARDLAQATTGSQPAIINAGVIYRRNGKPTIYHDNIDDGLTYGSNYLTTNPLSVNIVAGSNSNSTSLRRAVQGPSNWLIGPYSNQHSWYAGGWNHQISSPWSMSNVEIFTVIQPSANPNTSWRNGVSQTCGNNKGVPNRIYTGAKGAYAEPLNGFISEILAFNSDLSNYHRTIESNQGAYFSLSLPGNINKYGQFTTSPSDCVNKNGSIGGSSLLNTGHCVPNAPPTISGTAAASSITSVSAISGGTITSDQGATLTAGVCWSTTTGPTTALSTKTIDAGIAGSFTSTITGLAGSTTYYVRAYATNDSGTVYGNEISFTTQAPVIPTMATTTTASSINSTSAISGGNVTSDGGATITARGVCWSLSSNPTIADAKTTQGGTTGSFSSNVSGLTLGNTYYVRAYATNSAGTAYGSEISFTTVLGIGDSYQGGIIFYIFNSGDPGYILGETHGLVAATSDQGYSSWNDAGYTTTNMTAMSIGEGSSNTTGIIISQGNSGTYAAKLCRDYTGGSYSDWYLPSNDELVQLIIAENNIGVFGMQSDGYWTSSESGTYDAWLVDIWTNNYTDDKGNTYYVRAVRSF